MMDSRPQSGHRHATANAVVFANAPDKKTVSNSNCTIPFGLPPLPKTTRISRPHCHNEKARQRPAKRKLRLARTGINETQSILNSAFLILNYHWCDNFGYRMNLSSDLFYCCKFKLFDKWKNNPSPFFSHLFTHLIIFNRIGTIFLIKRWEIHRSFIASSTPILLNSSFRYTNIWLSALLITLFINNRKDMKTIGGKYYFCAGSGSERINRERCENQRLYP